MRNWDDLRVFLAVARAESLTGAAKALRLDPATVGRRVARLEQAVGQPLFTKSPRGYALTDAGLRVRDRAAEAETAFSGAMEEAEGDTGLTGTVRIGAPDGCANFLLPRVAVDLAEANPDLDVQIVAAPRVVNLTRREADIAITVSPPKAGRLSVQKITDYRLHLAVHRDWADRAGDLPLVGYIPDMIFDSELDYLSAMGRQRVARASNSVSVQLQMLRLGGAIGIVHDFALPSAPELRRVRTEALSLARAFYLVRHADDRRSDRLTRLARALAAGVRAEVARLEAAVQDA